jgi:hypothetical protein
MEANQNSGKAIINLSICYKGTVSKPYNYDDYKSNQTVFQEETNP